MPGMTDVKGVLLDVGGVLLPTPWELLEDFEARNGWPPGTLPWRGPLDPAGDPLWRAAQAGELPPGGYFDRRAAEISGLLGRSLSWPQVTRVMFETPAGLAVRPEAPVLVADARAAGLRTGLLTSKLLAFLSREVVERSQFLGSFDVLLDESETGVAKPDPRAYAQAATAMAWTRPRSCSSTTTRPTSPAPTPPAWPGSSSTSPTRPAPSPGSGTAWGCRPSADATRRAGDESDLRCVRR